MPSPDLLAVCATAFVAVFLLLGVLAAVMRLMLAVFPEKAVETDAAVLASIATVMQSVYPGTKVTKVEEIK